MLKNVIVIAELYLTVSITRFISFILYFLSVFNGFINVLINFILF